MLSSIMTLKLTKSTLKFDGDSNKYDSTNPMARGVLGERTANEPEKANLQANDKRPNFSSKANDTSDTALVHQGIVTTVFWVGEDASDDNGGVNNISSFWDEQWAVHFGGTDDPMSRDGFLPKAFQPKENPFYVALPYSDIDREDNRKPSAVLCPEYLTKKNSPHSWCKNSWVAIRYNSKIAFAQWEDTGPFGEDDVAYVFGTSSPANQQDEKAGLDVSPAVRDYLGLSGVNRCDWSFVSSDQVPDGPWKQTITSTPGTAVN